VLISNRDANTVYHVEVSFYANETLLDVTYYPWIEVGSSKYVYLQFKPIKSGAYIITAKVRYIEANSDGLSWAPLAIITPRVDGVFATLIKIEKEKRILLRARIPDTEKTFESTSNVEVLENTSQTLRENPL
jgi:hypothetical protein